MTYICFFPVASGSHLRLERRSDEISAAFLVRLVSTNFCRRGQQSRRFYRSSRKCERAFTLALRSHTTSQSKPIFRDSRRR